MNDPLRDNRIFPEEMQQQAPVEEKKPKNISWLWNVLGIVIFIALLWFGYVWYKNSKQPETFKPKPITPEEQALVLDILKSAAPERTLEQRDKLVAEIFSDN